MIIEKSKTGNIAADMVIACLAHNKRHNRKVKAILLSHKYWASFERYAKENRPEFEFKDQIEFKNVTLKKGSAFQTENLVVEYHDKIN